MISLCFQYIHEKGMGRMGQIAVTQVCEAHAICFNFKTFRLLFNWDLNPQSFSPQSTMFVTFRLE